MGLDDQDIESSLAKTKFQSSIESLSHVYPEIENHDVGQTFKNPRLVYKNLGNGRFKDVSSEMGAGITQRFSSRGAAFGDYDNDGDIDALILNMNELPSLLRNDGGNQNNWVKIKLIGTRCNRTAIGARVRVVTGTHAQMDEVHSGSSVMSQSDLRLHFGIGKAHASEGQSDTHHPRRHRHHQQSREEKMIKNNSAIDECVPPSHRRAQAGSSAWLL